MKIVYYISWGIGHFPHMFPYYHKLGGLVYTTREGAADRLKREYNGINVTTSFDEVREYDPDVVMYADYHTPLEGLRAKKVMVFHAIEWKGYFAQKKSWNRCEKFDLCLLYGNTILQEFKDNGWNIKYKIIGYPRFDVVVNIPKLFKNDKKTILIAPTWGCLSLLIKFIDEVIELSKTYNLIIKTHDMTTTFNTRDPTLKYLKKLIDSQSDSLRVFSNADIMPLMNVSDMIITDFSGSSSEFMYFNRPIIIADPDCLPIASQKKPDVWKVFKVCEKPSELKAMVDSQFKNDDMKEERYKYFKNLVYDEEDTTATDRGIKAINECIAPKDEKFIALKNRFFTTADMSTNNCFFKLPKTWWSRLYEYPFALDFVNKSHTVLDCCCGVYHPFKFALIQKAKNVYACDKDDLSYSNTLLQIEKQFDKKDIQTFKDTDVYNKVNFKKADIISLPYSNKKFDLAFCISVLEHMAKVTTKKGLLEIKRILKDTGKIVLTVDYPVIPPEQLINLAKECGLKIDGEYNYNVPINAIAHNTLNCYSMILIKETDKK